MTGAGGHDRRGATAAGGKPITDPSIHCVLHLTEGTGGIYASRQARWRRDGPNGRREGRRRGLGLHGSGEPEGEGERGEVSEDRELTLSVLGCLAEAEEG